MVEELKTREQNEALIKRAEELAVKIKEMLARNNGKYPVQGFATDLKKEDKEIMEALDAFFEEDCTAIESIVVGEGGYEDKDELKRLSDNLWLFRKVWPPHPEEIFDRRRYSILNKEGVVNLLQEIVGEKDKKVKLLGEEREKVENLLREIK